MSFIPLTGNIYLFSDEINEIMSELTLLKSKVEDPPSTQRLLDVICSILAEEYIKIAKQDPDVFLKHGDAE